MEGFKCSDLQPEELAHIDPVLLSEALRLRKAELLQENREPLFGSLSENEALTSLLKITVESVFPLIL